MPTTPEFEEALKGLNTEQKRAVDAIEGPVMVVAGPGTGKTQILTLRIANILQETDTEPENILALTFTESGVQSMRRRLVDLIGSPGYQVTISTFHGFTNDIIRDNPEEFPHIIGSRSIAQVDQIGIVEEIVDDNTFEYLKPFGDPWHYVRPVLNAIDTLKREGVNVEQFEKTIKRAEDEFSRRDDVYHAKGPHKGKMKGVYKDEEKQIAKNKELAFIYKRYQDMLRERQLYDYADMIMETYDVLSKNDDLLLRVQERYQYFLVDEHQDTNNAQNKILELLASHFTPNPNLFVVGDEKQSIFRFQGASLENFYYFKHLYPDAELITLTQNYRSAQSILDSAHSLIEGEAELQANKPYEATPIEVYPFATPALEHYFVARHISDQIEAGVEPHEIAVLYRDNKDADAFSSLLEKLDVPYQIESDQDIFSHPLIRTLLIIARAIHAYGDDRALANFLHLDVFNIEPLDVFKAIRATNRGEDALLYEVIAKHDTFREIYELLSAWVKRSKNTELTHFFEEVLRESGLLRKVLVSTTAREELDVLDSFFDEVRSITRQKPDATLDDFFTYLNRIQEHNISFKKKKTGGKEGSVRLMTAHRSKGLEFRYVYIVRSHDGKWGNKRKNEPLKLLPHIFELLDRQEPLRYDVNDDERRLFYVALTRAKECVFITYARENEEGREQQSSQFVVEIRDDLIVTMDTDSIEGEYREVQGNILETVPKRRDESLKDPDYIKELFASHELSVTALNNYLSCPWQYFYRNLIRLPEPEQPHLMFGNAMHATMDFLFRPATEEVVEHFDQQLRSYPLPEASFEAYVERGREALTGWIEKYGASWHTNVKTEFYIRGVELESGVVVHGVLDKLEFTGENDVVVVDYKTGKPKTRNYILGKTKNSDGGIWRQLVFYRLLLDTYKNGVYRMQAGEIDFLEPDAGSGKYRKERFEVTEEDVAALEDMIAQVADEIRELAFWDRRCDDKHCEYCELRNMIE